MSLWLTSISRPSPKRCIVICRADSEATDWTRETAPATATDAMRPMPTAMANVQRCRSRIHASRPVQRAGPPPCAMAALSAPEGPMSTSNDRPRLAPRRPPPPPPTRGGGPPRWWLPAAAGSVAVVAIAAGLYFLRLPQAQAPASPSPSPAPIQITSLYFVSDQVGWVGTLLANTSSGPILATTDGGK